MFLVEVLAHAGVRNVHGVSGDSLDGLTDSIRTRSDLPWEHVRRKEITALTAGAEAHITDRLAYHAARTVELLALTRCFDGCNYKFVPSRSVL